MHGRVMLLLAGMGMLGLQACSADSSSSGERWYSPAQVKLGKKLFAANCAQCHGEQAQGLMNDWKKILSDGSYPPPPLNGTAHAWHHSLPLLLEIIQQGGALYKGKMPGFVSSLSDAEQLAVIAYFQSFWDQEVYRNWHKANEADKSQSLLSQGKK